MNQEHADQIRRHADAMLKAEERLSFCQGELLRVLPADGRPVSMDRATDHGPERIAYWRRNNLPDYGIWPEAAQADPDVVKIAQELELARAAECMTRLQLATVMKRCRVENVTYKASTWRIADGYFAVHAAGQPAPVIDIDPAHEPQAGQ